MRLYLKIPENFVRPSFLNGFWLVNIPLVRIVKFEFLAQFPVNHFPQPVAFSLILFIHFCANLLHSLIILLIVSFLSPHNQHLLLLLSLSLLLLMFSCFYFRSYHFLLAFRYLSFWNRNLEEFTSFSQEQIFHGSHGSNLHQDIISSYPRGCG